MTTIEQKIKDILFQNLLNIQAIEEKDKQIEELQEKIKTLENPTPSTKVSD